MDVVHLISPRIPTPVQGIPNGGVKEGILRKQPGRGREFTPPQMFLPICAGAGRNLYAAYWTAMVLCKSAVQFTFGETSQMKKQFLPSAAPLNLL